MLTRSDLLSPSQQDKNAGNSRDLVKHTCCLALLHEGARERGDTGLHVVEAHGGKGVYVSKHAHLLRVSQQQEYLESTLGWAQAESFAAPPDGLRTVADVHEGEIAYAGSAVLHARGVVERQAVSLTLFDNDPGVRGVGRRVFSEEYFSGVRDRLHTSELTGFSEPAVLTQLRSDAYGKGHIVHFDPFAFVMEDKDEPLRSLYRTILQECDARIKSHALGAASVFFTWGRNRDKALVDLDGGGYRSDGYQHLLSAVDPTQRIVVTWCWPWYFSLLFLVSAESKPAIARAMKRDTEWLRPMMSRLEIT